VGNIPQAYSHVFLCRTARRLAPDVPPDELSTPTEGSPGCER